MAINPTVKLKQGGLGIDASTVDPNYVKPLTPSPTPTPTPTPTSSPTPTPTPTTYGGLTADQINQRYAAQINPPTEEEKAAIRQDYLNQVQSQIDAQTAIENRIINETHQKYRDIEKEQLGGLRGIQAAYGLQGSDVGEAQKVSIQKDVAAAEAAAVDAAAAPFETNKSNILSGVKTSSEADIKAKQDRANTLLDYLYKQANPGFEKLTPGEQLINKATGEVIAGSGVKPTTKDEVVAFIKNAKGIVDDDTLQKFVSSGYDLDTLKSLRDAIKTNDADTQKRMEDRLALMQQRQSGLLGLQEKSLETRIKSQEVMAANRTLSSLGVKDNPIIKAFLAAQPYIAKLEAASRGGKIGDQDLLDAMTKINTGGQAITDAQVSTITGGRSLQDIADVYQQFLDNQGGILSPDQRSQLTALGKKVYKLLKNNYIETRNLYLDAYKKSGQSEDYFPPDLSGIGELGITLQGENNTGSDPASSGGVDNGDGTWTMPDGTVVTP